MLNDFAVKFSLLVFMCIMAMMTGCDSSGYMMQEPYVISGTVYTGGDVSGQVRVYTYKRYDTYVAPIDPETGTFTVSVTIPDGPYLVRAELDHDKTYFSYTTGLRNPTIESATDLNKDEIEELLKKKRGLGVTQIKELSDEELLNILETEMEELTVEEMEELLADRVYYQNVNITPLTDMIIGMVFKEEPQAIFQNAPNTGFPSYNKIQSMSSRLDNQLSATFDELGLQSNYFYSDLDFNIFHNRMTDDFVQLLYILQVDWADSPDEKQVILTVKDEILGSNGVAGTDYIFFQWDFIEDDMVFDEATMTDDDVLKQLKTLKEFPVPE